MKKNIILFSFFIIIFSCTSRNYPGSIENTASNSVPAWYYVGDPKISENSIKVRNSIFITDTAIYAAYIEEYTHILKLIKYNGKEWVSVGDSSSFKAEDLMKTSLFIYEERPYILFNDKNHDNKLSVIQYDGNSWQYLGNPGIFLSLEYSFFVGKEGVFIATQSITLHKYDQTFNQWQNLSSSLFSNENECTIPSISSFNNSLYLAFYCNNETDSAFEHYPDFEHRKLFFTEYKNQAWNIISTYYEKNNSIYLQASYIENSTAYAVFHVPNTIPEDKQEFFKVMKSNGSQWEAIGKEINLPDDSYPSAIFVENGIPYIVFESINGKSNFSVMKYDGINWIYIGNQNLAATQTETVSGWETALWIYKGIPFISYLSLSGGFSEHKLSVIVEGKSFIDTFRRLTPPVFSLESGLYQHTQTLTLTAEEGTVIRYTTDGTFPTRQNGVVYQEPVIVKNTMKVRAFPPLYHPL